MRLSFAAGLLSFLMVVGLAIFTSLLSGGCAHKSATAVEKPAVVLLPPTKSTTPKVECAIDQECDAGMVCVDNHCVNPGKMVAPVAACKLSPLHFGFDSYLISDGDRAILDRDASCVKANAKNVAIEGNCDERGTVEYNMALGDMRARAVKKQLVMRGVPSGSLKAVSFGESRPLCSEHNEACWKQNRRAEVK